MGKFDTNKAPKYITYRLWINWSQKYVAMLCIDVQNQYANKTIKNDELKRVILMG